jgi:transcriptional regulator with XRE-family HTH domain
VSLLSKKTLTKKLLTNKRFRDAYVWEQLKRHVPFQVRTMRDERDWSQETAGEALGKPQSVISRYESPAYGKLTLQTLLEIAQGFDVGLLIKFVPFSRLVREYEDVSHAALSAQSVSEKAEAEALEAWATEQPTSETAPVRVLAEGGVGKSAIFALALRQSQTPIRHLRVIDSPTVTTAAIQRTLAFSSPMALAVESGKATTANQPLSVAETTPNMYRATA